MQKRLLPYTFSSGNARPHETDISSSEVLDKFSTGGIFRCAHLIILSFLLHLHRDRSLFIVWGIGALENFVCVTIKLT